MKIFDEAIKALQNLEKEQMIEGIAAKLDALESKIDQLIGMEIAENIDEKPTEIVPIIEPEITAEPEKPIMEEIAEAVAVVEAIGEIVDKEDENDNTQIQEMVDTQIQEDVEEEPQESHEMTFKDLFI